MGALNFILLILLTVSSQLQASDREENPEDIRLLRSLLEPIASLSAQFKQQVTDSSGFILDSAEGLFQVAQPARLHWHITAPLEQQIITDGNLLWLYDPDLEQVVIQPFDRDIGATPAILFSGDLDQLDSAYFIQRQAEGLYSLQPEQAGSLFSLLEISFDGAEPSSLAITDNLGNVTRINFFRLKINPKIEPDQFIFAIPPGIDVINNAR